MDMAPSCGVFGDDKGMVQIDAHRPHVLMTRSQQTAAAKQRKSSVMQRYRRYVLAALITGTLALAPAVNSVGHGVHADTPPARTLRTR